MRGVNDVFRPYTENTEVPVMEMGEVKKNPFRVKKKKNQEFNFGFVNLEMSVRNLSEELE